MQALVLMELREDAAARESFNQALRLSPNNADVLNNYGWFLCLRNDGQRGLELMQRALDDPLYGTPEKAQLSIGLCPRRPGRTPHAQAALPRAVMIPPDPIGARYNLPLIPFKRAAMT